MAGQVFRSESYPLHSLNYFSIPKTPVLFFVSADIFLLDLPAPEIDFYGESQDCVTETRTLQLPTALLMQYLHLVLGSCLEPMNRLTQGLFRAPPPSKKSLILLQVGQGPAFPSSAKRLIAVRSHGLERKRPLSSLCFLHRG